METSYTWHKSYKAAMIETGSEKLRKCLHAAKFAIDTRLHELQLEKYDVSEHWPELHRMLIARNPGARMGTDEIWARASLLLAVLKRPHTLSPHALVC
jgi:hypothetical protein